VVPVSHNAGTFWPRRGFVKKPGTIRVVIGEPIESAGKNPRELSEEVKQSVEAGLARIASSEGRTEGRSEGAT
jgi:1-acyl-sn-glycerol-3-phosphate acyltransferase